MVFSTGCFASGWPFSFVAQATNKARQNALPPLLHPTNPSVTPVPPKQTQLHNEHVAELKEIAPYAFPVPPEPMTGQEEIKGKDEEEKQRGFFFAKLIAATRSAGDRAYLRRRAASRIYAKSARLLKQLNVHVTFFLVGRRWIRLLTWCRTCCRKDMMSPTIPIIMST